MPGRSTWYLLPLFTTVVSFTVLFIGLMHGWLGPWDGTAHNYCEFARNHWIRQPANSWSNLAFTFTGWIIAGQASSGMFRDRINPMAQTVFFPVFLSVLCVLVGTGSFAMHAATTKTGGYFDMLAMYMIAAMMVAYACMRLFAPDRRSFLLIFLFTLLLCHIVHFHNEFRGPLWGFITIDAAFGVPVGIAALIEFYGLTSRRFKADRRWFTGFSTVFAASFIIWHFSKTGHILCDPESLIQGHAIWHILDAVCLYLIYRYYLSEDRSADQRPGIRKLSRV